MDKNIVKVLNILAKPLGITVQRTKELARLNKKSNALAGMVLSRINIIDQHGRNPPVEGLIFSKDRALQLHSLLCSYKEQVKNPAPLHVLYAASSTRHAKAYEEVFALDREMLSSVEKQYDFRAQTITLLEKISASVTFFLVDDIVFIRPVDFSVIMKLPCSRYVTSLRLAKHLRYCYTMKLDQPLPDLQMHESGLFVWQWKEGALDWNYPLSLDGHFFDTGELRAMVNNIDFKAPNSLENGLQEFLDVFLPRFGACFSESRIVNIPANKVQTEYDNRSGNLHQDSLLDKWENGMQMDYRKFYNTVNESAHQELPLSFLVRK